MTKITFWCSKCRKKVKSDILEIQNKQGKRFAKGECSTCQGNLSVIIPNDLKIDPKPYNQEKEKKQGKALSSYPVETQNMSEHGYIIERSSSDNVDNHLSPDSQSDNLEEEGLYTSFSQNPPDYSDTPEIAKLKKRGRKPAKVTKMCETCGIFFDRKKSNLSKHNFCSRECSYDYHRKKSGICPKCNKYDKTIIKNMCTACYVSYNYHNNPIYKIRANVYRLNNKSKWVYWKRKSYIKNKSKILQKSKEYYNKNRDKKLKYQRYWVKNNKEKVNLYYRERRKRDLDFRTKELIRKSINRLVKYGHKYNLKETNKLKNFSIDYKSILNHLKPFPDDISKYHIDHKKPLCLFRVAKEDGTLDLEEIKKAFAPENHQWLTIEENLRKGGKYEPRN